MILYHVSFRDENNDSRDAYVRAHNRADAVIAWQEMWEFNTDIEPDAVYVVPAKRGPSGVISWDDIVKVEK
jgi:hypothetical protein